MILNGCTGFVRFSTGGVSSVLVGIRSCQLPIVSIKLLAKPQEVATRNNIPQRIGTTARFGSWKEPNHRLRIATPFMAWDGRTALIQPVHGLRLKQKDVNICIFLQSTASHSHAIYGGGRAEQPLSSPFTGFA
ncbi:MAG: hypothetical protein DYH05_08470 [Acidobacteria bacterium ACB1]|nr:hypothetical protein [Pyrinomonadaceae bacterium]MCE7962515.1 hypothetical protein [Acidobacteria bacterium ACB1]RIJ91561.1 MAG: hypothetical protein DCC44_09295 [Acidobacteriota bacterium]